MNDVTKNAVRELRRMTDAWKKYGQGPTTARMAEIVDAACAREESREATATIPHGFYDPAVLAAGDAQRRDFRERIILTAISSQRFPTFGSPTHLAAELIFLADAICDAAYPQPKKETA